jgi:hypothetical protein
MNGPWRKWWRIGIAVIGFAAITGTAGAVEWSWTGVVSFEAAGTLDGQDTIENATRKQQKTNLELEHAHIRTTADLDEKNSFVVELCLMHGRSTSLKAAYLETVLLEDDFETLLGAEIGRFNVPFGHFNLLAEPDMYPTISRPMVFASHDQDLIMPSGFPRPVFMTELTDIGATLNGSKWFDVAGANHQLWYAIWAGNGLYNTDSGGSRDVSWIQGRVNSDNNENKAIGGRLSYSAGELIRVGGSYMQGSYDPDSTLEYSAAGIDVSVKLGDLRLDAEYVHAPTDFSAPITNGASVINVEEYITTGYYVQARYPFCKKWEAVAMYDVLERDGPALLADKTLPIGGADVTTTITKKSVGLNYSVSDYVTVKSELAHFCFDASDAPDPDDVLRLSTGLVVTF